MVDWAEVNNWVRIGLLVILIGTVFGLIAVAARQLLGDTGITAVDIAITGVLTAALVYLYFQQTNILESQRDLFTQQLNREARQQHTETLRDRVKKWHGNPERKPATDPTAGPRRNLPVVKGASFESAKNIGMSLQFGVERGEFNTVPRELREDPYFEDLLQNHAPDLRDTKSQIESLHDNFTSRRTKFQNQYDDGLIHEKQDYRVRPGPRLPRWVFELIVLRERNRLRHGDLVDRAIDDINRNDMSPIAVESSSIRIAAEFGGWAGVVYVAEFGEATHEELREYQDVVESEVREIVRDVLARVTEEEPYSFAIEAGLILEEAAEEVNKLDELLIEYYGRPIYYGDCKYLQEASI